MRGLQGGRRKGEIKKSEEGGRCKKKRLKINREGGRRGGGEFNGKKSEMMRREYPPVPGSLK